MYDLNPATYHTHQLKGNLNYPIYQLDRGLGSRLFNIVKSVGTPLLKEIILPTVKAEAGQVIKDIRSEECTQTWCQTCWKINFEERNTASHER